MRFRYAKLITFLIIILNIIIVYLSLKYFISLNFTTNELGNLKNFTATKNSSTSVSQSIKSSKTRQQQINNSKHLKKSVTVVFREFYPFDNDLKNSINNILNLIPTASIIILFDEEPYPPVEIFINQSSIFPNANLRLYRLDFDIARKFQDLNPATIIKTKYALLMPDSARLSGKGVLSKLVREFNANNVGDSIAENGGERDANKLAVVLFNSNSGGKSVGGCSKIDLDFVNWTIKYNMTSGMQADNCDMFLQKHAILIETHVLKTMPSAFDFPFPEMLYLQAKKFHLKKMISNITLQEGKPLFTTFHSKQQMMDIRRQQFKAMYNRLKIKKVVTLYHENCNPQSSLVETKSQSHRKSNKNAHHKNRIAKGSIVGSIFNPNVNLNYIVSNNILANLNTTSTTTGGGVGIGGGPVVHKIVSFYGCERNTTSCIGKVFSKPFFIYQKKHTPPCCLEKLKQIFDHVITELENVGIRYWLDNSALKSAIESNSLALDAFEIDISFNNFDLNRSNSLKKCQSRPLTDEKDFYWIKATDGNYFRVQYSKTNQIAVNLLPFDVTGDHVRPSGFYGWKAKEFSSEYLHPMSTVLFLGKNIMCPNNVRDFIEIKGN